MFDELSNAFGSARAAFANFLELLSLEARRAGLALIWMAAWGLAAAVCVVAGWLGIMAVLAMWAVTLGLHPIGAVLVVAALNLGAAAAMVHLCISSSRALLFPASRRQIAGNRAPARAMP